MLERIVSRDFLPKGSGLGLCKHFCIYIYILNFVTICLAYENLEERKGKPFDVFS